MSEWILALAGVVLTLLGVFGIVAERKKSAKPPAPERPYEDPIRPIHDDARASDRELRELRRRIELLRERMRRRSGRTGQD